MTVSPQNNSRNKPLVFSGRGGLFLFVQLMYQTNQGNGDCAKQKRTDVIIPTTKTFLDKETVLHLNSVSYILSIIAMR